MQHRRRQDESSCPNKLVPPQDVFHFGTFRRRPLEPRYSPPQAANRRKTRGAISRLMSNWGFRELRGSLGTEIYPLGGTSLRNEGRVLG